MIVIELGKFLPEAHLKDILAYHQNMIHNDETSQKKNGEDDVDVD